MTARIQALNACFLTLLFCSGSFAWGTPLISSRTDTAFCQEHLGTEFSTVSSENKDSKSDFYVACEREGRVDGPYSSFYANGNIKSQGQIRNEQLEGHWKRWFPDGKLESEGDWSNGKPTGDWIFFRPDGSPREEGRIKDGVKVCGYRFWDRSGALTILKNEDCLSNERALAIELELDGSYSKLTVIDKATGASVNLLSSLNERFRLGVTKPVSSRTALVVAAEIMNEDLAPAESDRPYVQRKSLFHALQAGVAYHPVPSLRLKASFARTSEYFLWSEPSGGLVLDAHAFNGVQVAARAKIGSPGTFELYGEIEGTRHFSKSFNDLDVEGANELNLALELSKTTDNGSRFGIRPYFDTSTYRSTVSEEKKVFVGLSLLYEIRL